MPFLFPIFTIKFSTAYGGKICFLESVILVLVSLVVKPVVGQGSSNLYALAFPQDLMPGRCHQESLECQMRNCYVLWQRLVHLFGKSEGLVVQINIFEHPCHLENYASFHPQVFSLYLLQHCEVYPAKIAKDAKNVCL